MKVEELSGKRILLHALVNLGDVVLSTSAAALLKQICHDVHITMMVRPFAKEIVTNNPVIDDVIIFDYKAKGKSFRTMWDMVKHLRREKFDACISLDRKLRPAILTYLARIPERVTADKIFDPKPSHIVNMYTDVVSMSADYEKMPQAENFQTIIRGWLHLDNVHARPVIGIPTKTNHQNVDGLINSLSDDKKHIALCVKGSFPLKTWPKEHFVELIKKLHDFYDADFFIIGAPSDKDYADEVIKLSSIDVQKFCGMTTLMDLAELFNRTSLFVTVDTGSLHIASTTTVPIVAMYGCGPADRWPPLTDKSRIVTTREECSPCHIPADACPTNPRPKCQWNITPEMVFKACQELL